jgi:hypothetical protein
MSMNKLEATSSATPDERWVRTENFFRRHFDDAATGQNFKNNYYGMFNFAKAMRTATGWWRWLRPEYGLCGQWRSTTRLVQRPGIRSCPNRCFLPDNDGSEHRSVSGSNWLQCHLL